ncbi:MAG: hypothetical protein ACOCUS_01120 [Polyangiales bacterium]
MPHPPHASHLENDARPDDMGVLLDGAARLCDSRLRHLYGTVLVEVAVPALGVHEGCLWVGRERILGHGLMLCHSLGDYRRWMRALVQGEPVRPRGAALLVELQPEGRAGPMPYRYEPGLYVADVRRRDVLLLAAVCETLAALPALIDVQGASAGEIGTVYPARIGGTVAFVDLRAGHPGATDTDRALARVQWTTPLRAAG